MNPEQISLLVYLESRMVLHQGMFNEKELTASDMETIMMWHEIELLKVTKLKLPDRTPNPIYTHRMQMTKDLFRLAWNARHTKAEQFNPTLTPSDESRQAERNGAERSEVEAPTKNSKLNTQNSAPPPTLHHEFTQFLTAHKAKPSPVQNEVAKELLGVLDQKKYNFWLKNPGTGVTWLFSTLDQFLTAIKRRKKAKGRRQK